MNSERYRSKNNAKYNMNALFAQWLSSSMQYIDIQNRTDPSHQMNTVVMRGDCGSSYCQEAIVKSTLNRSRVSFKNMNCLKISLWTTFPVDVEESSAVTVIVSEFLDGWIAGNDLFHLCWEWSITSLLRVDVDVTKSIVSMHVAREYQILPWSWQSLIHSLL